MNRLHFNDNDSSGKGSQDSNPPHFRSINKFNRNTIRLSLSMTILLSVISSPAFANRPSMDESAETEEMSAPASPSSVEIMMQQQNQQTGDVILLPATELQPGETIKIKLLDFPRRGMSMQKVQNEYGQPLAISDSIGKPPITRWTYQDRVVYFEYSNVIHVVAR